MLHVQQSRLQKQQNSSLDLVVSQVAPFGMLKTKKFFFFSALNFNEFINVNISAQFSLSFSHPPPPDLSLLEANKIFIYFLREQ